MTRDVPGRMRSARVGGVDDEATSFLRLVERGDQPAVERLFELLYDELRSRAARHLLDERADHTLQPTALVNEAWLRMIDVTRVPIASKRHFLSLAARAMRRILVDHARGRNRQKRSADRRRITLHGELVEREHPDAVDLLTLDAALERLQAESPHLTRIVELRFFAGLSREEVAETLGSSRTTVARDWRAARALLARYLDG